MALTSSIPANINVITITVVLSTVTVLEVSHFCICIFLLVGASENLPKASHHGPFYALESFIKKVCVCSSPQSLILFKDCYELKLSFSNNYILQKDR